MTPRATPNAILLLLLLLCTVAWSGVVGVPLTDSASEASEDEDEAFADTSNNISQNNDANNALSLDAARFAGHHDNVLHPMDISAWQEHFRKSPPDHQLDPRLPASPHPAPHVAPRYMLELYDKFEKERYAHPVSNIVRSFQSTESGTERVDSRHRVHTLVFNLSSVSEDEDISLAELRLHSTGVANSILVTISQVVTYTWADGSTETEARRLADTAIHGQYRRWEAVPLTDHVRTWIRSDNTELHVVSVRVSSGMPWQELADDGVDISPADTDLAPLLVVFSNDRSRRQSAERDLREMLHHEMDLMDPDLLDEDYDEEYDDDEGEGDDVTGGGVGYGDGEGIRGGDGRRDAGGNGGGYGIGNAGGNGGGYGIGNAGGNGNGYGMGNAVGNSVDDNEWNADGGDDDKGKVVDDGGDYEDEVSETAYDNIETGTGGTGYSQQKSTDLSDNPGEESANQAKHKLSRRSVAKDRPPGSDVTGRQSEHHVTRRSTRSAPRLPRKSRRRRNSCRRKALYVRFSDLNWHNWIIAPEGYMAYECTGRCYYPLSDHLTPTNHAIIQTLLHTTHRKRASRACCVPTRLDPISILYIDEKGVVTYKYKYKDMVVAECGCR